MLDRHFGTIVVLVSVGLMVALIGLTLPYKDEIREFLQGLLFNPLSAALFIGWLGYIIGKER